MRCRSCLCCVRRGNRNFEMRLSLPSLRSRTSAGLPPVAAPACGRWFSRDEAIMGTAIRAELWHEDAGLAERAIDAVMAEMHRIDCLMSPFKPESELSLVNREAARRAVQVCPELFDLIARS